MRRGLPLVLLCSLLVAGSAPAARQIPQVKTAEQGLAAAVRAGRVAPGDAARYRAVLARTAHALPRLSGARAQNLAAVLADVANKVDEFTAPRALTLFSELDVNARWFGAKGPPAPKTDVQGPDGVVYRYFPGHGLQFHPLAEFMTLHGDVYANRLDGARRLADALAARAIDRGDGSSVWEYEFRYGGGTPPWTSGMAQAVAAQALAQASQKLDDPSLLDLARRAEAAAAKLTLTLPAGPWVRLYSFDRELVFNAQLQTAVALRDYATIAGDQRAAALAAAMTQAAATMLPRFDTGFWTLYELGGAEAPPEYQDYVVYLAGRLKAQTGSQLWADAAARFQRYEREPPAFEVGPPPAPAAGGAGAASFAFSFWLSKASSVVVAVGGGRRSLQLAHGWHRVSWSLPRARPGIFPVTVQARSVGGTARAQLAPLVVLGRDGA